MKKVFFFFVVLTTTRMLFSNPIGTPLARISELYFDQNHKWFLELYFPYVKYHKNDFDSICVKTSSGFSRIKLDNIIENTSLFFITSDSLNKPLSINNAGDKIVLISYLKYYHEMIRDSLIFGNLPNASINFIMPGYSISRFNYNIFCKDKTPTIGFPNDTLGVYGTLRGYIYDKNNSLVKKGNFGFYNFTNNISPDVKGKYSTRAISIKTKISSINYYSSPGTSRGVRINPIEIDVNPDSIYERDIYFQDDYVGIKEDNNLQSNELQLINYPNPFNSRTNFFLKIPSELQGNEGCINIYNSNGQKVNEIKVSGNSTINWGGKDKEGRTLASGSYYYQLVFNNRVLKNGSMILLK
jgi:hypothetical protein